MVGVPRTSRIRVSWWWSSLVRILNSPVDSSHLQSFPGNRGLPLNISAKIQPTDQTSMAFVYSLKVNIISGALYQRVATYSVMKPELSSWEAAERARPKSQTLRSQLALRSKLDGLRSRWSTFAECIALRARRVW